MPERDTVSTMPGSPTTSSETIMRIGDVLALAEREILRGKADTALQLLQNIHRDTEEVRGTPLSAKYALVLAEAFAGKHDESAGYRFREAVECIENLADSHPELEVRVHESFGNFLTSTMRRPSAARHQYELGRQIAMKHKLWTRNAELELKIIRINLETDRDSTGLKNFETMKRLAFAEGYTPEEELAVWNLHFGKTDEALLGRRAARNEGLVGEAYFRSLFQSVRGHAE